MDASKKQREPVAFKSLAELKRFIRPSVEFKTVSHANHADMVGLTRVVTTVQTVGFYSKIKDQPEHPFSTCNHGKGFYTDFGKAGNYIFDGTTVKVKDTRKQDRGVIYELEFYDREQNMEETMMDRKMVNFIKEQYPPGTRIRLNAIGATNYSQKTIYLSDASATLHEFGHFLDWTLGIPAKHERLYLAEAQNSGLRDYAKTNAREYFADCFDYWIAYSGSEKRMETFRNAAPQTWAYFEALEKNNWRG